MGSILLEYCADLFAATKRGRSAPFAVLAGVLIVALGLAVVWVARSSPRSALLIVVLIAFVALVASRVIAARSRLHRAACLPLSDPAQRPAWHGHAEYAAPTAVSLYRLAAAVDAVRRGKLTEARDLLPSVDRALLRDDELRLLHGLGAMIALGLGDSARAAQQAIGALPTGSDDIDTALGRLLIANAWKADARLWAIDTAWAQAGVDGSGDTTLDRLRRLLRLRFDPRRFEKIDPAEARVLLEEARAVGDEELSAELNALAREQRGYR